MLALGKKLNFKVKRIPDASEYELTIDFKTNSQVAPIEF